MEEKARNTAIIDLRECETFKKVQELIKLFTPTFNQFCLPSSILANHSILSIEIAARHLEVRFMIDLNLNTDPRQMSFWSNALRGSKEICMVTINCLGGPRSMNAFMGKKMAPALVKKPTGVKKNSADSPENQAAFEKEMGTVSKKTESPAAPKAETIPAKDALEADEKKLPLVFAAITPTHLDPITANMILKNPINTFSLWIKDSGVDGILCTPDFLKTWDPSKFGGRLKMVTDIFPEKTGPDDQRPTMTPAQAIHYSADHLLIPYLNVNPPAKQDPPDPKYDEKLEEWKANARVWAAKTMREVSYSLGNKDRSASRHK